MKAFGSINGGKFVPCNQVAGSNGNSRVQRYDGLIASCQPDDGRIEWRPAETDGPYEWCRVSGQVVTFQPEPQVAYVFIFSDGPNL